MRSNVDHSKACDVLIVDPSGESSEVLQTVLGRHGFAVAESNQLGETKGANALWELVHHHRPKVLVIDVDSVKQTRWQREDASSGTWQDSVESTAREAQAELVLVGSVDASLATRESISTFEKPYRFASLIRTIEAKMRESQEALDDSADSGS